MKRTPTYTPGAVIVGRDLKAVATYKDASGSKEVEALAPYAVRAKPAGQECMPLLFPAMIAASREVDENSPPGTARWGQPVTAGDAGDILTYMLTDPNPANVDTDDEDFFTASIRLLVRSQWPVGRC